MRANGSVRCRGEDLQGYWQCVQELGVERRLIEKDEHTQECLSPNGIAAGIVPMA